MYIYIYIYARSLCPNVGYIFGHNEGMCIKLKKNIICDTELAKRKSIKIMGSGNKVNLSITDNVSI